MHQQHPDPARKRWMSILARAEPDAILAGLNAGGDLPRYAVLRGPETGMAMIRGRAGGAGAPFNLGEMSITRCTVRTESGQVGHAYVMGRDQPRAELAALADAMLQDPTMAGELQELLIGPLETAQRTATEARAAKAAATTVQFFSLRNMRT